MDSLHVRTARLLHRLADRCKVPEGDDPERGDVPGWVLVTMMSAGLVSALWLVAEPQLSALLSNALNTVSGP